MPGKLKLNTNADKGPFGANKFLKNVALQIITITVKIMNGLHAYKISLPLCGVTASGLTSFCILKIFLGWNFLENTANTPIVTNGGMMSANSGPTNTVIKPCNTV